MLRSFLLGAMAYVADIRGSRRRSGCPRPGFFSKHCVVCQRRGDEERRPRSHRSPLETGRPRTFNQWVKVFDKVDKQKMPPPQKRRPTRRSGGVSGRRSAPGLRVANLDQQRAGGRVVLRRLNRVEYENTLHDLLSIDVPCATLPPRGRHGGRLR